MPQMSPLSWLYLFFYFIGMYLIIMILINSLVNYYKNLNNSNKKKNSILFKYKW
uniref:ATP synthase complex subunit 8 n=1 Tax=Tetrastichus howardi TaxID=2848231 RepID=A0A8F5GDB3_9HYME|nr:ATP synthase F0 subunit 8 [Tetrastichus howardi]QXM14785.1 ATP synthase F0 subunit 8 [Tetrastichus howardi]